MNRLWSAPDDENDLPEWMRPETYHNPKSTARKGKNLNEAILEAMSKPAVDLSEVLKNPIDNL